MTSPSACLKFSDRPDSFGVALVEIELEPEELGRLNANIASKRPVTAKVKIRGRDFPTKVNYAGRSTLHAFKKSYDVDIKSGNYKDSTHYRLSSQSSDKSMLRSLVGFYAFERAGIISPIIEPAYVYTNRKPMGLYMLLQQVDLSFYKNHSGDVDRLFKAKLGNARFDSKTISSFGDAFSNLSKEDNNTDLVRLIEYANNPVSDDNLRKITAILDLDNALTYWAVSLYLNNFDGLKNNFFIYRSSTGKFRFSPWDLDRIFENEPAGEVQYSEDKTPFTGNQLIEHLMQYESVKNRYIEICQTYLTETFPTADLNAKIDEFSQQIDEAYANDRVLIAKGNEKAQLVQDMKDAANNWHNLIKDDLM